MDINAITFKCESESQVYKPRTHLSEFKAILISQATLASGCIW